MSEDRGYFKRMARGGALAMTGKVVTYPVGLLLAIVLARILSPEELGGYFLATSLILISAMIVQFGAGPVMLKFIAAALAKGDGGRARRALVLGASWMVMTSTLAVVLLHVGLGDWLLSQLEDGGILSNSITTIALLIAAYATITFCCEVLRGFSDLGTASLFAEQLLQRLLLLAVLGLFWAFDGAFSLNRVLLLMIVSSAATALLGVAFIVPKFRRLDSNTATPVAAGELARQAPPFFFMRLNFWLMDTGPIWVLGIFHPPEVVALYGVGNLLALIVLAPWTVVNTSLGPAIVKLHTEQQPELLRALLGTVAGFAMLAASCVAIALVVFGDQILAIVFSEELAAAHAATVVLVLGRGISVVFGAPALLLSMTKHQLTVLRVLFPSSLAAFGAYFLAAYYGDVETVAMVSAGFVVIQAAILAYLAKRILGLSTLPSLRIDDWGEMRRQVFHKP